jgi:hypothetical protein
MMSSNSNNVNNRKFYVVNKKKEDNKVVVYVEKEVENGAEDEGPFAIKVKCKNGNEYDFSLRNNER